MNSQLLNRPKQDQQIGERFPVEVLLDKGFTTGWLALDTQDCLSLGWVMTESERVISFPVASELELAQNVGCDRSPRWTRLAIECG